MRTPQILESHIVETGDGWQDEVRLTKDAPNAYTVREWTGKGDGRQLWVYHYTGTEEGFAAAMADFRAIAWALTNALFRQAKGREHDPVTGQALEVTPDRSTQPSGQLIRWGRVS